MPRIKGLGILDWSSQPFRERVSEGETDFQSCPIEIRFDNWNKQIIREWVDPPDIYFRNSAEIAQLITDNTNYRNEPIKNVGERFKMRCFTTVLRVCDYDFVVNTETNDVYQKTDDYDFVEVPESVILNYYEASFLELILTLSRRVGITEFGINLADGSLVGYFFLNERVGKVRFPTIYTTALARKMSKWWREITRPAG